MMPRIVTEKKTHFGRAGEFFAMSELLLRGWNVAVPVVDIGDDVFVIDDNDKTTRRLQVKSATQNENGHFVFSLSREQLRTPQQIELFYMLLMRLNDPERWRFLVIARVILDEIRQASVKGTGASRGRGRPSVSDDDAQGDAITLTIKLASDDAIGWKKSLKSYLDQWPADLAVVSRGPENAASDPVRAVKPIA